MNSAATEMEGRTIARDVAVRARALDTLQSMRRLPTWIAISPYLILPLIGIGLTVLRTDTAQRSAIALALALSLLAIWTSWDLRRKLAAVAELLLQRETEPR